MYAAQQPAAATAGSHPSPDYDAEAERRLLDMANRERAKVGLPPLQKDDGLTQAAREHGAAMAAQKKLSHQLSGEPNLVHRLATNTKTRLDQAGENVAFADSVDQAQESLMHSPPHRANLLNAGYNVAGFSVVRSGSSLYVTQDFGHSLPSRSDDEADVLVARSVDRMRAQTRLPRLERMDNSEAADAACAMARADSLRSPTLRAREVVRYTTAQPQILPANASRAIESRSVRAFAVGSCYARTPSCPTGVHWVALLFY
jgi:cysteine-rich secretory family protein